MMNKQVPNSNDKVEKTLAAASRPVESGKKEAWVGKYKSEIRIIGDLLEPVVKETEWEVLKGK